MTTGKICIYLPVDESGESHRRLESAGCTVLLGDARWRTGVDRDSVLHLARGAHVLMGSTIRGVPVDASFLDELPELRIISKYTIGVEDIDLDAATERGVLVTHCPTEANWGGVAEGTLAFMLTLLKRVRERDRHVKQGGWRDSSLVGRYIGSRQDGFPGLTIGIVGLGRIGARVADLLAPWRVRVLAVDPYVELAKFVHHDVERVDLEMLLRTADVVSLHCDLTSETRGLIGSVELGYMKQDAVLLNTARGALVDSDALADALDSGALAGAALDVLDEEPPPPDSRLKRMDERVLLSPHMIAANDRGTLHAAIPWATDATLAALAGRVPEHVANVAAIPRWRERVEGRSLIEREAD
jgi:phosphoglycerate dehydrogenase-like enzyme